MFDSIKALFGRGSRIASETLRGSVGRIYALGLAKWMHRDARVFADEGYQRNAIVFRCVNLRSENIAAVNYRVYVDGEPNDEHPLKKLLDQPNPSMGGREFREGLMAFKDLAGNAYFEVITNGTGLPSELWLMQPYQMKAVEDGDTKLVRAWVWEDGDYLRSWEVDKITGKSDLVQWKNFSPLSRHFGQSVIEAAAHSVDQHNSADEWNQALLQNSGSPSGMLSAEDTLSDAQYEKLKKEVNQRAGPGNAGRIILGEGGLKWTSFSFSPKEMDWLQGRNASAVNIGVVFGIPSQMLNIPGAQTYANFGQARLGVWQDTYLPQADKMAELFTKSLAYRYDPTGRTVVKAERDGIPALEESRTATMVQLNGVTYLTLNEKRQAAGYEPLDESSADQVWVSPGQVPISELEDQGQSDEPAFNIDAIPDEDEAN